MAIKSRRTIFYFFRKIFWYFLLGALISIPFRYLKVFRPEFDYSLNEIFKDYRFVIVIFLIILGYFLFKYLSIYSNNLNSAPNKINFLDKLLLVLGVFVLSIPVKINWGYLIFFSVFLVLNIYFFIGRSKRKKFWQSLKQEVLSFIKEEDDKEELEEREKLTILNDEPIEDLKEIENIQKNWENLGKKEEIFRDYNTNIDRLIGMLDSGHRGFIEEQSYTICLDAAWGQGKTSFINIVKKEIFEGEEEKNKRNIFFDIFGVRNKFFKNLIWITYNPWHFSNQTELIEDFFKTLENRVNEKYGFDLSRNLGEYIRLVSPMLEKRHWIFEFYGSIKNKIFPPKDLKQIKDEIRENLDSIDEKIAIVLDDIDRLQPNEIYQILKLIKLTADFPNIIFILPFDYKRVTEIILEKYKKPYDNYLQKIINYRITLKPYTYNELLGIFVYFFQKKDGDEKENQSLKIEKIEKIFEYYVLKAKKDVLNEFFRKKEKEDSNDLLLNLEYEYIEGLNIISKEKLHDDYYDYKNKGRESNGRWAEFRKKIREEFDHIRLKAVGFNDVIKRHINTIKECEYLSDDNQNDNQEEKVKNWFVENLITPRDLKELANELSLSDLKGGREIWGDKVDEVAENQTFF